MADGVNITEAALRAAFNQLRDAPLRACGVTTPHVVHPNALQQDGWTVCAMCFSPLPVFGGRIDRNEGEGEQQP